MKLLALFPGWSLISLDILLSSIQVPDADAVASSVVVESFGEDATADKSGKYRKEVVFSSLNPLFNFAMLG